MQFQRSDPYTRQFLQPKISQHRNQTSDDTRKSTDDQQTTIGISEKSSTTIESALDTSGDVSLRTMVIRAGKRQSITNFEWNYQSDLRVQSGVRPACVCEWCKCAAGIKLELEISENVYREHGCEKYKYVTKRGERRNSSAEMCTRSSFFVNKLFGVSISYRGCWLKMS